MFLLLCIIVTIQLKQGESGARLHDTAVIITLMTV